MKKYTIKRNLNNNMVYALDDELNEVVIMGSGVGFNKRKGDIVGGDCVEKVFINNTEMNAAKLNSILSNIRPECFDIVKETVRITKEKLGIDLDESIYIYLADHINFALERKKNNIEIPCPMQREIKLIYNNEYEVGNYIINYIKENFKIELPQNEAVFITLHIINSSSKLNDMNNVLNVMDIGTDIINIIEKYFAIKFKQDSYDYLRILTHLNFFAKRIIYNKFTKGDDEISKLFKINNKINECINIIGKYLLDKYKYEITEEERTYLAIHIKKCVKHI